MKITPHDVQQQEFKSRLRGYDCEEVEAFLRTVSDAMEDLVKENAALKEALEAKHRSVNAGAAAPCGEVPERCARRIVASWAFASNAALTRKLSTGGPATP